MPADGVEASEEQTTLDGDSDKYEVIVIGAGAAGVGVSIALIHAGVENFLVVDRDTVGASFDSWPAETRFITPSFPSNSIGMLDLNSIAIGVSPAYSMKIEHPTGPEFAQHLRDIAEYFELPLQENTDVKAIEKKEGLFHLETNQGTLFASNIIWSAGEYQYPCTDVFTGSELCRHTATVPSYAELEGDDFLIIGGYESGVDAAYHLSNRNKKVRLFDLNAPWDAATSDPSVALSTYSFERMRNPNFEEHTELHPETIVDSVTLTDGIYEVNTEDGQTFQSKVQPLLAAGFDGSHKFVSHLFEQREDGFPSISEDDESTTTPGMYLCGPSVRHDGHVFCFIYKYRQRFAIVANSIASSLGIETEEFVAAYRSWGMYLDDLSCCGQECLTC
jgi:putative flavoprotein involved in K+ transport